MIWLINILNFHTFIKDYLEIAISLSIIFILFLSLIFSSEIFWTLSTWKSKLINEDKSPISIQVWIFHSCIVKSSHKISLICATQMPTMVGPEGQLEQRELFWKKCSDVWFSLGIWVIPDSTTKVEKRSCVKS